MRFAILSVLAIAGTVFADSVSTDGVPINQISDGQIQGQPTTSETSTETVPAAYTPPAYGTTSVVETTPTPETTPTVETTPVVVTPTPETTTATSAAPVTTTTTPLASYPLPNNMTTSLTTGAPVPSTTRSTYQPSSATEASPAGSETPQPANPNAAGIVGVQMGLTAVAVAGLLVFLA